MFSNGSCHTQIPFMRISVFILRRPYSRSSPRIKIGIGEKPHPDYDLADWVLSEFSKEDKEKLFTVFGHASNGLEKILSGDIDAAMRLCNSVK